MRVNLEGIRLDKKRRYDCTTDSNVTDTFLNITWGEIKGQSKEKESREEENSGEYRNTSA